MTDKEKFEEEALAEFLYQTGIPKEKIDQYSRVNRIEFHDYGETYELKNPGLAVIFNSRSSDGVLPVLYFPKKALEQKPTTKNCRTCRNQGSHNGVCDICKKYSCWTEIEPVPDKLRAEIERQEKWLMDAGYNAYNVDIAFNAVKLAVDKHMAESEDEP